MSKSTVISYKPPGPESARFLQDDKSQVMGLMGPVGSGKSVACAMKIWLAACGQAPTVDGVRKTRFAIVRNTYPELKSTTIKTWVDWFPEHIFGRVKWDIPITQHIRFPLGDGTTVDCELLFLAMDRPDHVRKLLSLEVTGVWLNEVRELPKAILDGATGRIGRYPSQRDRPGTISSQDWPTRVFVCMDTNPPDDDHWLYRLAEEETPATYAFYRQPGGLSSGAENRHNLPANYYDNISEGKTPDWIQVYVHGEYGTVSDGKPVYPEYNDRIHCAPDILKPIKQLPLYLGWDFGLTPACVIAQFLPIGQLRVIDELCSESVSIANFARSVVRPHLATYYPGFQQISVGDPAGTARGNDSDESTCFMLLSKEGFRCDAASTNSFLKRREAVVSFMSRMYNGEPNFLISPLCHQLRKGFRGSYKFRRIKVAGDDRFKNEPDKNQYSHPHDALQYVALKLWTPGNVPKRRKKQRFSVADNTAGY